MICKRCKTAQPESSKICPYCSARLKTNNIVRKTMGLITIITAFTLSGLYLYYKPEFLELNKVAISAEIKDGESYQREENTENMKSEDINSLSQPETGSVQQAKGIDTVFEILEQVYSAANQYLLANKVSVNFVTNGGFLYDHDTKAYVKTEDLITSRFLDTKYTRKDLLLFYLYTDSFDVFSEIHFTHSSELQLFAGIETSDGIALYSAGQSGVLFREHYNQLVKGYGIEHGDVKRPSSKSSQYHNIVNTVLSYDFITEGINVRYLAVDEKYAFIVIAKESNPNRLYSYALKNNKGAYGVIVSEMEDAPLFPSRVNAQAVDMNLDLLPSYDPYKANKEPKQDYAVMLKQFAEDNVLELSAVDIQYLCGSGRFVYFSTKISGDYMAIYDNGATTWVFVPVEDWKQAESILLEHDPNPPLYIIPQA